MTPEDARRVARRFLIIRLVGVGQALAGTLSLFLLLGTGLSRGSLLFAGLFALLTIVSLGFLRH